MIKKLLIAAAAGLVGCIIGAAVFVISIVAKVFIYEKAQTNIDEYYLKYDS